MTSPLPPSLSLCAAEAIFLCYLVDQEENDGDVRPYYASAALRRYMETHRPSYRLPAVTPPEVSREEEGAAIVEQMVKEARGGGALCGAHGAPSSAGRPCKDA